jgi:hypothetical protein
VRFDSVLGDGERGELVAALSSNAARLTSWTPCPDAGLTYALVRHRDAGASAAVRALPHAAAVDEPALVVLEVAPLAAAARRRVRDALAGRCGLEGVRALHETAGALIVEFDAALSALSLLVDLIEVEAREPRPQMRPLLALDDGVLAAFAGASLGVPDLDAARVIETFSEPLLAGELPC